MNNHKQNKRLNKSKLKFINQNLSKNSKDNNIIKNYIYLNEYKILTK